MKLQTAVDRVNLSQAEELVKLFAGKTDIIELGTSLVKDYGLFALKKLNQYKKDSLLLVDIKTSPKEPVKISWPHFEVELLKKNRDFSKCKQLDTNNILDIKNEFLYYRNDKLYCLDDYIDHRISLNKGDIVKVIGVYGIYAYIIYDEEVGWVKYRYLRKI